MKQTQEEKKFWEGTNFYVFATTLVASYFVGFTGTEAIVTQLVLAVFSLRNLFKTATIDPIKWISDSNFWMYLASIVSLALPDVVPPELFDHLQDVVLEIVNWNDGSLQSLLVSIFSIASILLKKFGVLRGKTAELLKPVIKK